MIRRPPRSTQSRSSAASDVYKRQGHERPVGGERLELVAMGQQPEQEVAGRPVGGLRPGREQEPEEGEDLLVTEALGVELGVHELADEVTARLAPARLEDPRDV